MSKIIECPVKCWPGTITIPDYLNYPQVMAFRKAMAEAQQLGEDVPVDTYNFTILPGLCACVERWDIKGLPEHVTPETFPGAPASASVRLMSWLIGVVVEQFKEAEEVPNA